MIKGKVIYEPSSFLFEKKPASVAGLNEVEHVFYFKKKKFL